MAERMETWKEKLDAMDLNKMEGSTIMDRYELHITLNKNPNAVVYGGIDTRDINRSKVVIKVIDKIGTAELIGKEKALKRLSGELRALSTLRHPNIVTLYEYLETDKYLVFIMEYVEGGDMYEWIVGQGAGLPDEQAKDIFRQLIEAVNYCHQNGVSHRDIKPGNILVTASHDNIKLCDFGICAWEEPQHEKRFSGCGTKKYEAPEILNSARAGYFPRQADVWSCGVVLYSMCLGELPFDDGANPEVVESLLKGNLKLPSEMPLRLKQLLSRMLDPNPHTRISVQEVLSHPYLSRNNRPIVKRVRRQAQAQAQGKSYYMSLGNMLTSAKNVLQSFVPNFAREILTRKRTGSDSPESSHSPKSSPSPKSKKV